MPSDKMKIKKELSRDQLENFARTYAKQFTERASKRVWEGGGDNPEYKKAVEAAPGILTKIPSSQKKEFMGIVEVLKKRMSVNSGSSRGAMIPTRGD
jgi:hypothetical protein